MNGPRECHTEWSQRRRNIVWHPLYMQSKKKWYKWSYLQNRKILLDLENEFLVAGGEGRMGERIVWKFGTDMSTLLYLKWITKRSYCIQHRELCSVLGDSLDGRGDWRRMDACICMDEFLRYSRETITTLLISYMPIQKKSFLKTWILTHTELTWYGGSDMWKFSVK